MKGIMILLLCGIVWLTSLIVFSRYISAGQSKKAILVVSFGTSYADTRQVTIEACEEKIKETFSDYEVRRAFTSSMIIKIMKKRDHIHVDTPEEALQKLHTEGFSEVIVQPLHIIPGSEFHDVVQIVKKYESVFEKIHVGGPLLTTTEDYMAVVDELKEQLPAFQENEAESCGRCTKRAASGIPGE